MHVTKITFSIEKTTPLMPLTKDPADQYANVKPMACCEIAFEGSEANPESKEFDSLVSVAFATAEEACYNQLAHFHEDFVNAIGK